MPFKSKKQEQFMAINHPEIFKEWKQKYGMEIAPAKKPKEKKK